MEVKVFGYESWSHPALPGLKIAVGMVRPRDDAPPQPFVSVSTEDFGAPDDNVTHVEGKPIMAVYLNDSTLYDVERGA